VNIVFYFWTIYDSFLSKTSFMSDSNYYNEEVSNWCYAILGFVSKLG